MPTTKKAKAKGSRKELITPGKATIDLKEKPDDGAETTVIILRIKSGLVRRVDKARRTRPVKTPRNTWLVEAVLEKLKAEQF